MKRLSALLLVASALAACTPVIHAQPGPLRALLPDMIDGVRIGEISVEGDYDVIERYSQTQNGYDFSRNRTDDAYDPQSLERFTFSEAIRTQLREELDLCATGAQTLNARVLIDDLTYDERFSSLWDAKGYDTISGWVELFDPAAPEAVVARYRIQAGTNSGGVLTRIITDRIDAIGEEFGRALCMEAFGRNPRGRSIDNNTRG